MSAKWWVGLTAQRHQFYRSPKRLMQLLWGISSNLQTQFGIFRIMAGPAFTGAVRADPILPFRYLTRDYLARGLSFSDRACCLAHHYRRLRAVLPARTQYQILHDDIVLLEIMKGGDRFAVRLGRAKEAVREGELSLWLDVNGSCAHVLQFTIIPGRIVGSKATEVALISRLQGMIGCYASVRIATKAFHEVAPPALLLAVLEGIAQGFSISEIAGVAAESQFCFHDRESPSFKTAYDDFWLEIGAKKTTDRFFTSPIPLTEKPLSAIQNGHQARARKKRAYKRQLAAEVCKALYQ